MKKFLTFLFLTFLLTNMPANAVDLTELFSLNENSSYSMVSPMSSPELTQYSIQVGKEIISNFELPNLDEELTTTLLFKIDQKGKLINYEILEPSGNKDYDARVVSAIKRSSPYPPPTSQQDGEVGIVLNMNLSIIKLIKMLSSGLDIENLFENNSMLDLPQGELPDEIQKKLDDNNVTKGKRYLVPNNNF